METIRRPSKGFRSHLSSVVISHASFIATDSSDRAYSIGREASRISRDVCSEVLGATAKGMEKW